MIVWGGYDINGPTNTGSSFDPLTNNWTALPITKAPSARGQHTALWTGTEMVIYGGFQSGGIEYNVEASRYVPSTGWDDQMQQPVTFPGRIYHSMVYDATTTRVIVFGGRDGASVFDRKTFQSARYAQWAMERSGSIERPRGSLFALDGADGRHHDRLRAIIGYHAPFGASWAVA